MVSIKPFIEGSRSIPMISLVWLSQIIKLLKIDSCTGDLLQGVDEF